MFKASSVGNSYALAMEQRLRIPWKVTQCKTILRVNLIDEWKSMFMRRPSCVCQFFFRRVSYQSLAVFSREIHSNRVYQMMCFTGGEFRWFIALDTVVSGNPVKQQSGPFPMLCCCQHVNIWFKANRSVFRGLACYSQGL